MRLSDDFDDKNAGLPVIYVAIGVSVFTLVILGVVLLLNKKDSKNGMETAKKNAVIEKLKGFYDKFADISHGMFFFFFEKE